MIFVYYAMCKRGCGLSWAGVSWRGQGKAEVPACAVCRAVNALGTGSHRQNCIVRCEWNQKEKQKTRREVPTLLPLHPHSVPPAPLHHVDVFVSFRFKSRRHFGILACQRQRERRWQPQLLPLPPLVPQPRLQFLHQRWSRSHSQHQLLGGALIKNCGPRNVAHFLRCKKLHLAVGQKAHWTLSQQGGTGSWSWRGWQRQRQREAKLKGAVVGVRLWVVGGSCDWLSGGCVAAAAVAAPLCSCSCYCCCCC